MHLPSLLRRTEEDPIYSGICVQLTHCRRSHKITYVITDIVPLLVTRHNFVPELYIFLVFSSNHVDTNENMLTEHRQPNN